MPLENRRLDLPRAVYWFTALAFGLRLGLRLYRGTAEFFESGYSIYFDIAQSIATGHGISYGGALVASRVPLYPILLAVLTQGHERPWPVLITQSLFGAGTTFGAALLARQIYRGALGNKAAVFASGITALYPYYVVHDTALQETSLFTLLTLLAVLSVQRTASIGGLPSAVLSGLLLGVDLLTRVTITPFAAFAALWLILRKRTAAGLVCALLLVMIVSPWLWRSHELTGIPTLSTETGQELWTGNNGSTFRRFPQESIDRSREDARNTLTEEDQRELSQVANNEALTDRWYLHKGLAYMRSHPWITVRDGLHKIAIAFGWLPAARRGLVPDVVHALSYGPVMLLGLWGMWRRRFHWREDSLIYSLFVTFALVTGVFFGDTSHRSYLDVYWIVFAAGALASRVLHARTPLSMRPV